MHLGVIVLIILICHLIYKSYKWINHERSIYIKKTIITQKNLNDKLIAENCLRNPYNSSCDNDNIKNKMACNEYIQLSKKNRYIGDNDNETRFFVLFFKEFFLIFCTLLYIMI